MTKFMNARARESVLFASPLERALQAIGVAPAFSDGVFGDMAEEYAQRSAERGVFVARFCYLWDIVAATPYFLANAARYGSPGARVRLGVCVGALALLVTMAMSAVISRNGPPVRLVASAEHANAVVVNSKRPVQLEMRVLDEKGHQLESRGVHFAWASGRQIHVSSAGVVTCTRDGDAAVRASLGGISTLVNVQCRRIIDLQASAWMDFVVGDSAEDLPFVAYGAAGQQVTELRGSVHNADSSIATLSGSSVHPRAVGHTAIDIALGDYVERILVLVHERVPSFEGLRPNQELVAVPVHFAAGDTVNLTLPQGNFWLKYLAKGAEDAPPTITVNGMVSCKPGSGSLGLSRRVNASYCMVHAPGASVTLSHRFAGTTSVNGLLALDRVDR